MRRPILRYFGGKYRIAKWIIEHLGEHRIYVEPFGGAASVLMKKAPCYAEIYNDLDDSVYSLFKVLANQNSAKELQNLIKATPYSRREFEIAHIYHPCPIEKARRLIIRSFMGFGAASATNLEKKTGFRCSSKRQGSAHAHDWQTYWPEIIKFHERLKTVVIENEDAQKIILQNDSPETVFYVDPPYSTQTRPGGRYKHEMDDFDHVELLSLLKTVQGRVVLSGYETEFYSTHLSHWHKVTKEARANKAGLRTEVLWIKDAERCGDE